jgi:hypothetical protein
MTVQSLQCQFVVRPACNNLPSDIATPGAAAPTDSARHTDTTSRSVPGNIFFVCVHVCVCVCDGFELPLANNI